MDANFVSSLSLTTAGDVDMAEILRQMIEGRTSAATRRAYQGDLKLFFAWTGRDVSPAAVEWLCGLRTGQASALLTAYKIDQLQRDPPLSSATINRRLASIRSLIALAAKFDRTTIDVDRLVDNVERKAVRDVRGPTVKEVVELLQRPDRSTLEGKRDYAILVTLWETICRRAELCKLNIEHYDGKRKLLTIYPKGWGTQPRVLSISGRHRAALDEYIDARSAGGRLDNGEPIFVNHSRSDGGRLKPGGLYHIMRKYGADVLGRRLTPHQMRHAGATALAKKTRDMRLVQAAGGWARLETAQKYMDAADDLQGRATETLSKLA